MLFSKGCCSICVVRYHTLAKSFPSIERECYFVNMLCTVWSRFYFKRVPLAYLALLEHLSLLLFTFQHNIKISDKLFRYYFLKDVVLYILFLHIMLLPNHFQVLDVSAILFMCCELYNPNSISKYFSANILNFLRTLITSTVYILI